MAKYLDSDGLLYFWTQIKTLVTNGLSTKVDKESGKGLSANDFTASYKTKLDGIADGANNYTLPTASSTTMGGVKVGANLSIANGILNATDTTYGLATTTTNGLMSSTEKKKLAAVADNAQVNVIETIKVNGTTQSVASKAVNIVVPTDNKALTNGAGYQTSSQVQTAINAAVGQITGIDFKIVTSLPTTGIKGTIYLVDNGGTGNNDYDEYIWLGTENRYEKIGSTAVDLSGYLQKTDMVAITNTEIDTILAA